MFYYSKNVRTVFKLNKELLALAASKKICKGHPLRSLRWTDGNIKPSKSFFCLRFCLSFNAHLYSQHNGKSLRRQLFTVSWPVVDVDVESTSGGACVKLVLVASDASCWAAGDQLLLGGSTASSSSLCGGQRAAPLAVVVVTHRVHLHTQVDRSAGQRPEPCPTFDILSFKAAHRLVLFPETLHQFCFFLLFSELRDTYGTKSVSRISRVKNQSSRCQATAENVPVCLRLWQIVTFCLNCACYKRTHAVHLLISLQTDRTADERTKP